MNLTLLTTKARARDFILPGIGAILFGGQVWWFAFQVMGEGTVVTGGLLFVIFFVSALVAAVGFISFGPLVRGVGFLNREEAKASLRREADAVYGVSLDDSEAESLLVGLGHSSGNIFREVAFVPPADSITRYGVTERVWEDGRHQKLQLAYMLGEWRLLDLAGEKPVELARKA